jgi:pimeloyl-ACP methyl ester carboxylesterase
MNANEFDDMTKHVVNRRLSRRQALAHGGAGFAAAGLAATGSVAGFTNHAAAQEATPLATPTPAPALTTLTGIAFENPEFDAQFLRALDTIFTGGADIGECFMTARRIVPGDEASWYAEWQATGDAVYAAAEASLAAGHSVSAREGFLRAVTYYRTSSIFMYRPPMVPEFVDAYERQRDAFQQAAELSEWSFELVQIPYEDTTLEGYFLKPADSSTPLPTLVFVDGYEGTKEELYFAGGVAALRRGYAILLVDGPGQGGALIEQGLVFRPDWEAVVTPQIDWLLTRPEVDPKRIALIGRSWGGYLAPRAATAEHRIAALIADAAQYAPGAGGKGLLPEEFQDQLETGDPAVLNAALEQGMEESPFIEFSINRGMLTHGVATPLEYVLAMAPYTLEGIAGNIQCPTLICEGENDIRGGGATPLYDAITAPKEYILFTNAEGAGEHDEAGAAALFAQRVFDWLDDILKEIA